MLIKFLKHLKKRSRKYWHKVFLLSPKNQMPFDNVFVVGTNKTGTTSMHHFLKELGLRHLTINNIVKEHWLNKNYAYLDLLTRHFNSFDDVPWNRLDVVERYMRAEKDYRFILTNRSPTEWFDSLVRFNAKRGRLIPQEKDRESTIKTLLYAHNEKVVKLASIYSKPLLIIDVTSENNVESKITEFLNLPPARKKFPHVNRTK